MRLTHLEGQLFSTRTPFTPLDEEPFPEEANVIRAPGDPYAAIVHSRSIGLFQLEECTPRMFIPDEMLMAHYAHLTVDSLHTHMLQSGTLTVDRATDELVEGTFTLEAPLEVSVDRADLEAFQDSLREYTRDHSPEEGHLDDFPEPPPFDLTVLEPPLPIEGTFTAAPGVFSDRMPHSIWSITIGAAIPDQP